MREAGLPTDAVADRLALVDSHGLVHASRTDLDPAKAEFAARARAGMTRLVDVVDELRPTIMVGATGAPGTFTEEVVRAMAAVTDRPVIMPLSNPTRIAEARPDDLLRWTDGRAIVATGSPFAPADGRVIGQANNVFVFPGIGLGTMVAGARAVSDAMILAAARSLADAVAPDRLDGGVLYPPISALRLVSRAVAVAVAREAIRSGLADDIGDDRLEAEIDAAMWWPAYVPYHPARERRT